MTNRPMQRAPLSAGLDFLVERSRIIVSCLLALALAWSVRCTLAARSFSCGMRLTSHLNKTKDNDNALKTNFCSCKSSFATPSHTATNPNWDFPINFCNQISKINLSLSPA